MKSPTEFARRVFFWCGLYGVIVIAPQYFLEHIVGQQYPPAITHPEYFYGFVGVGLAWQLTFLLISRDPIAMRPVMLGGVAEKFSFACSTFALIAASRAPAPLGIFAAIDFIMGVLFLISYFACGKAAQTRQTGLQVNDDDDATVVDAGR